jgi:hypothetical protein
MLELAISSNSSAAAASSSFNISTSVKQVSM